MLKREFLSCQGIALIPSAHGSNCLAPGALALQSMSTSHAWSRAGNGMHLEIISMIWLWIMCCSEEVKPVPGGVQPTPPVVEEDIDSDDDLEAAALEEAAECIATVDGSMGCEGQEALGATTHWLQV